MLKQHVEDTWFNILEIRSDYLYNLKIRLHSNTNMCKNLKHNERLDTQSCKQNMHYVDKHIESLKFCKKLEVTTKIYNSFEIF